MGEGWGEGEKSSTYPSPQPSPSGGEGVNQHILREIRNAIAHEYPLEIEERLENIALALSGYDQLKDLYANIKQYAQLKQVM